MQQGTVPIIGGSLGHHTYKRNYVVGFIGTKTNPIFDVKIATRAAKHTNGNHTGFPQGEEADEVLRRATRNINWFETFFFDYNMQMSGIASQRIKENIYIVSK